ncbi:hypothetical protein [Bacteroides sp.]
MMQKTLYTYYIWIILLGLGGLTVACSESETGLSGKEEVVLAFQPEAFVTRAATEDESALKTVYYWIFNPAGASVASGFLDEGASKFLPVNLRLANEEGWATVYAIANVQQDKTQQWGVLSEKDVQALSVSGLVTDGSQMASGFYSAPLMAGKLAIDTWEQGNISLPLVRLHGRFSFYFRATGENRLTVNSITLSNIYTNSTYFDRVDKGGQQTVQLDLSASDDMQEIEAGTESIRLSLPGSVMPWYVYSYQSPALTEKYNPVITLELTFLLADGKAVQKTLSAQLYDIQSENGKKHYGVLRNYSYSVYSEINTNTQSLDVVAVNLPWVNMPDIDIPAFQ